MELNLRTARSGCGNSVARLIYPLTGNIQLSVTIELVSPATIFGIHQLKLTAHIVMIQQRAAAGCGLRACHFAVARIASHFY